MAESLVLPGPTKIIDLEASLLDDVATAHASMAQEQSRRGSIYYRIGCTGHLLDDLSGNRIDPERENSVRAIMEFAGIDPAVGLSAAIDVGKVNTGVPQRAPGWHADRIGEAVVVSSILPTEFLTGELRESLICDPIQWEIFSRIKRKADFGTYMDKNMNDEVIGKMGLGISTARPNALTHFLGSETYHRSPLNTTGAVLDRTFVRFGW